MAFDQQSVDQFLLPNYSDEEKIEKSLTKFD